MPQSQRLLKPVPKRASTPLFLGAENVLLWLRPDSDTVTTGGSRTFTASDKSCFVGTTRITTRTAGVDFWLEFWFKPTNVTNAQYVFDDGAIIGAKGAAVRVITNTLQLFLKDAVGQTAYTASASVLPTANVWYHVLLAADRSGNAAWYVNGAAAGTNDISAKNGNDISGDGTLFPTIGNAAGGGNYLGGSISHFRYGEGYVPTATDVTWLYNNKNPRTYADLDELGGSLFTSLKRNYECNETSTSSNLVDQHDAPGDGSNDLVKKHAELATNGAFTSDASWTKGTGWTIDAGDSNTAASDGTQAADSDLEQACTVATGGVYATSIKVTRTAGNVCVVVGGTEGTDRAAAGTFTQNITVASTNNKIAVRADADFVGTVDDFSVKATSIAVGNGPAEAIASDSVGTHHATLTGFSAAQLISAWTTDTHNGEGYALKLNGVGNYLQVGSIGLTGARSYSVWVKPSNVAGNCYILDGDENRNWFSINNKNVNIGYSPGTAYYATTDAPIATNGEWYHIVGTLGATDDAHIYVNGVEYTLSKTGSGQFFADSYNIGSYNHGAGFFFAGDLDDLRIYNVALTPEQVAELYLMDEDENSYGTGTGTATVTIPGLVAQWKFEDGPFGQPGEGDPLINWVSKEGDRRLLQQTTAGSRPTYHLSEVNGHPAVYFNGTSMFMSLGSAILSGTEGTVAFAVKFADPTSCTILSSADTATATKYAALGTNGSDQMQVDQDETDVNTTVRGGTTLGTDWHILFFESNGSAYFLAIDDVDETLTADSGLNNGDWWDDSTGKDNTVLGALVTSGGTSLYFEGYIADIIVYKKCLSVAERTNLYKNYLKPRYL